MAQCRNYYKNYYMQKLRTLKEREHRSKALGRDSLKGTPLTQVDQQILALEKVDPRFFKADMERRVKGLWTSDWNKYIS